jgi:hypothetical protein
VDLAKPFYRRVTSAPKHDFETAKVDSLIDRYEGQHEADMDSAGYNCIVAGGVADLVGRIGHMPKDLFAWLCVGGRRA